MPVFGTFTQVKAPRALMAFGKKLPVQLLPAYALRSPAELNEPRAERTPETVRFVEDDIPVAVKFVVVAAVPVASVKLRSGKVEEAATTTPVPGVLGIMTVESPVDVAH